MRKGFNILYFIIIIFFKQEILYGAEQYILTCQNKDINYYICGKGEQNKKREGVSFYHPVQNPSYTALFHRYPDEAITHRGIDVIGNPEILSATSGVVAEVCYIMCGGYGMYVIVEHPELSVFTLYGHLSKIFVQAREQVHRSSITEGTILGIMGNTGVSEGTHLHFEVRDAASHAYKHRLDPVRFLAIHIKECNNMFGLVDALYSSVHYYQQWYGLDGEGYIYVK